MPLLARIVMHDHTILPVCSNVPYFDVKVSTLRCREAVKLVLLAPLALVRAILIVATLFLFATVCAVATIGAAKSKPLAPWRRRIVTASSCLGKVVLVLLGFWVNVKGWDNYLDASKHGTVCPTCYHQLFAHKFTNK
jgi:hypothetical protein